MAAPTLLSKIPVSSVKADLIEFSQRAKLAFAKVEEKANEVEAITIDFVREPQFKTVTLTTVGGALTFGGVGGAFGLASGIIVGTGAGLIPALVTFGTSIPVGAAIGGGGGFCLGGSAGVIGGGALGYGTYKYRIEIRDGLMFMKRKSLSTMNSTKATLRNSVEVRSKKLLQVSQSTCAKITLIVSDARKTADESFVLCSGRARALAADRSFQVTSASALVGGTACGLGGGAAGAVAGAATGVVPALLTFGLSIPIGAMVGLCTGAVVGGTAGALAGGAGGYQSYTHRSDIKACAETAWTKACDSADFVKSTATKSASDFQRSVKTFVQSETGGTA